jgi:hypothetical protein
MVLNQIEHLVKMVNEFNQNDQCFFSQVKHFVKMANDL